MKIELRNIKKSFGERKLFSSFNATFEPGTITVIMGDSGCGKTTLINIIGLIETYDEGEIIYNGQKIYKKSMIRNHLQNDIAFIFQNYGLLENETVAFNVSMSNRAKTMSKDGLTLCIKNALTDVNLPDISQTKTHTLSGGEQQRVAIAKAMIKEADVILADEPTASIDSENARQVMNLLKKLADEGKTVIIVTHSSEVAHYADQIIKIEPWKGEGQK